MDYVQLKVEVEPADIGREVLVAELAELGFESFVDTDKGIEAYIQEQDFSKELINKVSIVHNPEFKVSYVTQVIEKRNWNAIWEKEFDPVEIDDRCVVRAPFHEKRKGIKYDIVIEPKMSFGTGHHETTTLMLEGILNLDLVGRSVLDVGCGTGVLAILAKMKGAGTVLAIDIDAWAFENTRENVNKNGGGIDVKHGEIEMLTPGKHKYDVILANINRNILVNSMKDYGTLLCDDGDLLISGFFDTDGPLLIEEADKYGLKLVESKVKKDWSMLQFKKCK